MELEPGHLAVIVIIVAAVIVYFMFKMLTSNDMGTASAHHILLMDKKGDPEKRRVLVDLKREVEEEAERRGGGVDNLLTAFAKAATHHSECPSKERGGDLGTFGRGAMVPPFDRAVFEGPVGQVVGPVQTNFGWHLILTTARTDPAKPKSA